MSCDACHCNKSHKLSFSTSTITSTRPLQIIFSDVWTSLIMSYDGFKYYVIFVDHFTKYIWLYPLKQKSHVKDIFIRFKAITKKHFNQNIHTLYSDNGGEYVALTNLLALHGISHRTTPPHTPEHNGFSKRRHLHIVKTSLTLLSHASIPLSLDSCFCYSYILDQYDAYSNTKSVISLRTNLCFPSQLLQT
jgi:transposase InsO family protein